MREEKRRLSKAESAFVPEIVPRDPQNVGEHTAKLLGFFEGANNIVATFDKTWLPIN